MIGRAMALLAIAAGAWGATVACGTTNLAAVTDGGASAMVLRTCGTQDCAPREFCVETEGAVCRRLPPEGVPCPEGCTRTPHCCSCASFACLDPPREDCPSGARCDCLAADEDAGVLRHCLPPRRTCEERPGGPRVVCVRVAFDEDPFADGD